MKNFTESNFSDFDFDFCSMSLEELFELCAFDIVDHSLFLHIQDIIVGPILWTVCLIGIALNILIVLPKLISCPTSSSILEAAISFALVIRALSKLLIHDFIQGDST